MNRLGLLTFRRPVAAAGLAALLVTGLCSCTSGHPGSAASEHPSAASSGQPSASPGSAESAGSAGARNAESGAQALQQDYESVIGAVLPSIVEITTSVGLGSGIVFDSRGDIVTNDHVVGKSTSFKVQFASSASPVKATLVGTFAADDLAVIRVSDTSGLKLKTATFGDSSKVKVGEIVLAMGNPLGLASSVTNGIVSAVGRTLNEPSPSQSSDSPGATLPDSIQTSAAINPGNSGGALVDLQDQVIGIPTLAATDQQEGGAAPGIGFAIPSNTVTKIANQLIKNGEVTESGRAALGIAAESVIDATGQGAGVGVAGLTAGGGAAKAGVAVGDTIVKVDGKAVRDTQELSAVLATLNVGTSVPVVVVRGGADRTTQVTLGQLTSN